MVCTDLVSRFARNTALFFLLQVEEVNQAGPGKPPQGVFVREGRSVLPSGVTLSHPLVRWRLLPFSFDFPYPGNCAKR